MISIQNLLELKKIIKRKKPNFRRRHFGKKKSLSDSWRKPRGVQNKQRLQKKGKPKRVEPGYGSPRLVKHFTRKGGLRKVLVENIKDLGKIDKEKEGIVIRSSVSLKNKLKILEKAKELGITLIEPKEKEIRRRYEKFLKEKEKKKSSKKVGEKEEK